MDAWCHNVWGGGTRAPLYLQQSIILDALPLLMPGHFDVAFLKKTFLNTWPDDYQLIDKNIIISGSFNYFSWSGK